MKTVLVLSENDYFSDSRVRREVEALVNDGWQVEVALVPIRDSIEEGQKVGENIRMHPIRLSAASGTRGVWPKLHRLREANRGYLRISRTMAFDVVHANDLETMPAACRIKRERNCRLVYDAHELFPETQQISRSPVKEAFRLVFRTYFSRLECRLIRQVDAVITVNESIALELSWRYKIPIPTVVRNCPSASERPRVLRQGDDPFRRVFPQIGERRILLYNGGFSEGRGLEQLLVAMQWIRQDAVLLFMGQGSLEEELGRNVTALGLEKRVFFFPPVPTKEVVETSHWADLGILPYPDISLNSHYSLPNKLFEYLLAGLPVVGSDLPEIRKVLVENQFGVVFDAKDPEDIASKINTVLADEGNWRRMKENVLSRAPSLFNWEKEATKLIDVYKSIYAEVTPCVG